MDPATAIANAIGKFFEFLCTPAGQKFCADMDDAAHKLGGDIAALVSHLRSVADKKAL